MLQFTHFHQNNASSHRLDTIHRNNDWSLITYIHATCSSSIFRCYSNRKLSNFRASISVILYIYRRLYTDPSVEYSGRVNIFSNILNTWYGARGSVVGEGTMLLAGTSRVGFLMRSLNFFNSPNPSSRTMALWSTQLLTEMSARNLSEGKQRPARKADNLNAICEPIV
jgi:hypothetical protein